MAAPPSATAFNTTPINNSTGAGGYSFSNGNRSITCATGGSNSKGTVITANAVVGKKYCAFSLDVYANNYADIGISNSTNNGDSIGFDSHGVAYYTNNTIFGSSTPSCPLSAGQSSIIGLVMDQGNKVMWFTVDGAHYYGSAGSGNTALTLAQVNAGTSGVDISTPISNGAIYAAVGERDASGKCWSIVTTWPWATPSGYTQL